MENENYAYFVCLLYKNTVVISPEFLASIKSVFTVKTIKDSLDGFTTTYTGTEQ